MKVSDELMIKYYELLTDLKVDEIHRLKVKMEKGELHPRQLKVDLAKIFVTRFHSDHEALKAEEEFNRIFVSKGLPDKIEDYSIKSQEQLWICKLINESGLVSSNSEAKRMINSNAVEIEGEKIKDDKMKIDLKQGKNFVLKVGKKKFIRVVVTA